MIVCPLSLRMPMKPAVTDGSRTPVEALEVVIAFHEEQGKLLEQILGPVPVTAGEQAAAVASLTDSLQMMQCMGQI